MCPGLFMGAENGIRTRDPDLGKVVLYQLSYFRSMSKKDCKCKEFFENCNLMIIFLIDIGIHGLRPYCYPRLKWRVIHLAWLRLIR